MKSKSTCNVCCQRSIKAVITSLIAVLIISVVAVPATGHGIFKKALEKKYKEEGLRVTCFMCHIKGEKKTERNDVGELFFKEFEGQDLSAKWEAVEGDERKKLEADIMVPALEKALETIYQREKAGESETTYGAQIPAGEVEGTKLKKKK